MNIILALVLTFSNSSLTPPDTAPTASKEHSKQASYEELISLCVSQYRIFYDIRGMDMSILPLCKEIGVGSRVF